MADAINVKNEVSFNAYEFYAVCRLFISYLITGRLGNLGSINKVN